jgi:hypothetical protein
MIQSHSPSAIATAPEIPSSSNMAAYYDPRSSASYYQQVNSTPNQQMYMSPSTHPSAAAAAAAAAAAGLSSTSLPPLSQLLPPPTAPIESSNPASNSQSQTVTSKADPHHHHHHHQMQHNSMNAPSNTTPDYFNSQAPMSERSNRSMSAAPFAPGTQQEMTFRKSIDGQRPMYPPTVTNDLSRRSYISTHDTPENYYLLQQQQHPHHPSGEPHSIPQYPPQHPHHPNTAVVPSSDLSMFSTPHPALSQYHRAPHYHLPSPPTSVIDGVLMTDPHSMQGGINANNQKVFSFVPLPGLNQKKRPRRKYHEVERLYRCNFQECNKSYGTLNHLNAHVSMQRHVSIYFILLLYIYIQIIAAYQLIKLSYFVKINFII